MNPISLALVCAQFLLIALIVSPVSALLDPGLPALPGLVLMGLGMLLGVRALMIMRAGTFSVLPEPVANGRLVTAGPYRYVRHPMYSAVLLVCFGAVLVHLAALKFAWFMVLIGVLLAKIQREERLLAQRYPDYRAYRHRSKALIPGLY